MEFHTLPRWLRGGMLILLVGLLTAWLWPRTQEKVVLLDNGRCTIPDSHVIYDTGVVYLDLPASAFDSPVIQSYAPHGSFRLSLNRTPPGDAGAIAQARSDAQRDQDVDDPATRLSEDGFEWYVFAHGRSLGFTPAGFEPRMSVTRRPGVLGGTSSHVVASLHDDLDVHFHVLGTRTRTELLGVHAGIADFVAKHCVFDSPG